MGQIAITAGAVIVWWKMISSAFKLLTRADKGDTDEKKAARRKDYAWLLGPAAIIFWLQAATGEGVGWVLHGGKASEFLANPFGVFGDKTTETTADKPTTEEEKKTKEIQKNYVELPMSMVGIFSKDTTYDDIKELVEKSNDGKMRLKWASYDTFLDKFRWKFNEADKNPEAENFLNTIGRDDKNGILDLALNSMGANRDKIKEGGTTSIGEAYAKLALKLWMIPQFIQEYGYSRIDPSKMDKVEAFLSDPDAKKDDLKKLEDEWVFVKGDIEDKTGLAMSKRIEELFPNDKTKQEALLIGMNKFYEYFPTADKKIELIGNDPKTIIFKTYGKETKINIDSDKKILVDFNPSGFNDYFELFKAANLTNRIKKICEDKKAVSKEPFKVSALKNIDFDSAKLRSFKFDTEIQSAGRGWELEDISPTLEAHKKDYCDYLNNTKPKFWEEATNA